MEDDIFYRFCNTYIKSMSRHICGLYARTHTFLFKSDHDESYIYARKSVCFIISALKLSSNAFPLSFSSSFISVTDNS